MLEKDLAIDIAKYFMDFLETNFKKGRAPKRAYKTRNNKNLLVGIDLKGFPKFRNKVLKLVSKNFEDLELSFKKGAYIKENPTTTLNLVIKYCERLTEDKIDILSKDLNNKARDLIKESSNIDEVKIRILDLAQEAICSEFIEPLIEEISTSLLLNHVHEEDSILEMKDEICNLFSETLESYISEFVVTT